MYIELLPFDYGKLQGQSSSWQDHVVNVVYIVDVSGILCMLMCLQQVYTIATLKCMWHSTKHVMWAQLYTTPCATLCALPNPAGFQLMQISMKSKKKYNCENSVMFMISSLSVIMVIRVQYKVTTWTNKWKIITM